MSRHYLRNVFLVIISFFAFYAKQWAQTDIDGSAYTSVQQHKFEYASANEHYFLFQDSRGYMWGIDPNFGLMRFDGHTIRSYSLAPEDSTSYSGCPLWPNHAEILEDRKGRIWIKSSRTCLDRYDPVTGRFDRIADRMPGAWNLWDLFEDSRGDIWIGTTSGAFRYDLETEELSFFDPPDNRPVTVIFEDAENNIWLVIDGEGSSPVLFQLDNSGNFADRIAPEFPPYPGQLSNGKNYSFKFENSDSILLLTEYRLYLFEPRRRQFSLVPVPFSQDEYANSLFGKDELILVGTSRERIFRMNLNGTFVALEAMSEPKKQQGLGSYILDILQDRDGTIWFGIANRGMNKLLPQSSSFATVNIENEARGYWSGDQIFDYTGNTWFNAVPEMRLARGVQEDTPILDIGMPGFAEDPSVFYRFDQDNDGNLWVASFKKEGYTSIRQFGRNGELLKTFSCAGRNEHCFNGAHRVSFFEVDREGFLWLATERSLFCFDPRTEQFVKRYFSKEIDSPIKGFSISFLYTDRQNNLWLGGNNQVKIREDKSSEWKSYIFDFQIGDQIQNWVNSICEDVQGFIWMATDHGVVRLSVEADQYRIYTEKDMIPGMHVSQVFEDYKGRIWAATDFLARYAPDEDRFHPFTAEDGVRISNWVTGVYTDKDHYIYLPTIISDMSYFHPDSLKINTTVPDIYFTGFQLFNAMVKPGDSTGILEKSLDFTSEITLNYGQNDFSIHFTAPEYRHPKATLFAIKLEGFHDDWQQIGGKREATFTNLNPGSYTFMVKARNHHGFWSKTPRSLPIIVRPPWYRSWWAYSLWATLIFGSIYGVYRFQLNRRLTLAEAERLRELDQAKTRLYTNITHEFRTPLTVILGMANQVRKDPGNWLNEGTRLIRRNGKQLLNLVNQLLDLSKLESGHMPLHLIQGDIVSFLQYLIESFHSYADSKDIRLHFKSDVTELKMDHDPEKIQNIISNLLSNGIKFTPAGGDVYVHLRVPNISEGTSASNLPHPEILIEVSDNGPGIPPEHLPHIFDRFYQADDTYTRQGEGTGIGLALTKELVKVLGGRIDVESEPGKGTRFKIRIPVKQRAKEESSHNLEETKETLAATILPEEKVAKGVIQMVDPVARNLVLLVDDNQDVITYLSSVLSLHYQIATASNGQEGIDKALELVPDLIVSDVMMPVKDGYELCQTLKMDNRTDHIPIILLTAKADQPSKVEGLTHGADAYLAKPFHKEELLVRLEKLIELRRRLQQRFQQPGSLHQVLLTKANNKEDVFLQKVIKIIEKQMGDENFGIPKLCKEVHMSRTTLFRKLKALTGKSAINIIRSCRLEKARDLLKTTDLSVSEICFQVGFRNPNYFSTVFSEEYGRPPSEERNQ